MPCQRPQSRAGTCRSSIVSPYYNAAFFHSRVAMTNTHFGYQTVPEDEKVHKVAGVFHSVAAKYDVMNDLMSAGLHRIWKAVTIAHAGVRPGFKLLDIAGGTGDLAM